MEKATLSTRETHATRPVARWTRRNPRLGSLEGVRRTGKKNKGKKRSERRAARHGRGRPATFEPEGNRTDQTAGRRFVSPFFLLASRRPSYRSVQIRAASFNGSDPTTATLSFQIINLVKLWLTFL